jgi:hypothetical protein
MLIVTGRVTVPTGGYQFRWGTPLIAESDPVRVTVELQPVTPTGMATQALVTHEVRGSWPSPGPIGSVSVTCAGRALAVIGPVETAH